MVERGAHVYLPVCVVGGETLALRAFLRARGTLVLSLGLDQSSAGALPGPATATCWCAWLMNATTDVSVRPGAEPNLWRLAACRAG